MSEQETTDQPLPLVAHLTELRDKLLRALLAVLVLFICLFPFANEIYAFVSEPLRAILPPGASMIATEVATFLHTLQTYPGSGRLPGDALRFVPGLEFHRARHVPPRKAFGGSPAGIQCPVILRRCCLCVLRRISADLYILYQCGAG